jgi:hypothetical protein
MMPAKTTCELEMAQVLQGAGNRSPNKSEADMTLMSRPGTRVPELECVIGKDAVRVREATDTFGAQRERQKTTDHGGWQEQRTKVSRPLPDHRRPEKDERKQNNCLPDLIRSPHPSGIPYRPTNLGRWLNVNGIAQDPAGIIGTKMTHRREDGGNHSEVREILTICEVRTALKGDGEVERREVPSLRGWS